VRRRATLARAQALFRAFLVEQTDPARFYGALAADAAEHVAAYGDIAGRLVLDVGGGPGYFAAAFEAAGATYRSVDSDVGEMSMVGDPRPGSVLGSGMALPFRDRSADVCYSSNVLEHVPEPWRMADEMVRVTKPGGLVFLSYTTWYGPWGGHETAPWHFLGGAWAARRYFRREGRPPKNEFGRSLFKLTVRDGLAYAGRMSGVDVVDVLPRYNPWWTHWLLTVPGVRELVTWNLVIVARKR
jgi:ubiquinone/menaquinone biosynthesis C-methylase UbiE